MRALFLLVLVSIAACTDNSGGDKGNNGSGVDADADGFSDDVDCDDADGDVHPEADEVCDGKDNDCNGDIDDDDGDLVDAPLWYLDGDNDLYGVESGSVNACDSPEGYVAEAGDCDDSDPTLTPETSWFADTDGDFFGDVLDTLTQCEEPPGFVRNSDDCDDTSTAINPDAQEICDGEDNDCDLLVDSADDSVAGDLWFIDSDQDGYGDGSVTSFACDGDQPKGFVDNDDDCDDSDALIHPDTIWYADADGDGFGDDTISVQQCDEPVNFTIVSGDCDDTDPAKHPNTVWFPDVDEDGYGAEGVGFIACLGPPGAVIVVGDCDDGNPFIHPDADETCDQVDNDCDDSIDDDDDDVVGALTWYADSDKDGFGTSAVTLEQCQQPAFFVENFDDCDDNDQDLNPNTVWYEDVDADDAGDNAVTIQQCDQPANHVLGGGDCDPNRSDIYPGAPEICDGSDNDCDGLVDSDDGDVEGATTYYADADGDLFGNALDEILSCIAVEGFVENSEDCNDSDAAVHPETWWYADVDKDDWGDDNVTVQQCETPPGAVLQGGDCNDGDATRNPGAEEVCDGVDNDCDQVSDPVGAWWATDWPARIPVTVTAASTEVGGPPVAVAVDFAGALATLGIGGSVDEDSIRVVHAGCGVELPSQYVDSVVGLFEKVDHEDAVADGEGTVVFLWDTDGAYETREQAVVGSTLDLEIYFDTEGGVPPGYTTDLVTTADSLANAWTVVDFDEEQGGLLDSISYLGSPTLGGQTVACCGNGVYSPVNGWEMRAQLGVGTVELVESGPVLGMLRASGTRTDGDGTFDYTYEYWMFADRPEVYAKIHFVAITDVTVQHVTDFVEHIRPWQFRTPTDGNVDPLGDPQATEGDGLWRDLSGTAYGVAFGYIEAPNFNISMGKEAVWLMSTANDYAAAGSPIDIIPAGVHFQDHAVGMLYPHTGEYPSVADDFQGLREGTAVVIDAPEMR